MYSSNSIYGIAMSKSQSELLIYGLLEYMQSIRSCPKTLFVAQVYINFNASNNKYTKKRSVSPKSRVPQAETHILPRNFIWNGTMHSVTIIGHIHVCTCIHKLLPIRERERSRGRVTSLSSPRRCRGKERMRKRK